MLQLVAQRGLSNAKRNPVRRLISNIPQLVERVCKSLINNPQSKSHLYSGAKSGKRAVAIEKLIRLLRLARLLPEKPIEDISKLGVDLSRRKDNQSARLAFRQQLIGDLVERQSCGSLPHNSNIHSSPPLFDARKNVRHHFALRLRADVALAVQADGNIPGLHVAAADDEHR